MFNRNANAQWFGNLKNGNGTVHLGSGLLKVPILLFQDLKMEKEQTQKN